MMLRTGTSPSSRAQASITTCSGRPNSTSVSSVSPTTHHLDQHEASPLRDFNIGRSDNQDNSDGLSQTKQGTYMLPRFGAAPLTPLLLSKPVVSLSPVIPTLHKVPQDGSSQSSSNNIQSVSSPQVQGNVLLAALTASLASLYTFHSTIPVQGSPQLGTPHPNELPPPPGSLNSHEQVHSQVSPATQILHGHSQHPPTSKGFLTSQAKPLHGLCSTLLAAVIKQKLHEFSQPNLLTTSYHDDSGTKSKLPQHHDYPQHSTNPILDAGRPPGPFGQNLRLPHHSSNSSLPSGRPPDPFGQSSDHPHNSINPLLDLDRPPDPLSQNPDYLSPHGNVNQPNSGYLPPHYQNPQSLDYLSFTCNVNQPNSGYLPPHNENPQSLDYLSSTCYVNQPNPDYFPPHGNVNQPNSGYSPPHNENPPSLDYLSSTCIVNQPMSDSFYLSSTLPPCKANQPLPISSCSVLKDCDDVLQITPQYNLYDYCSSTLRYVSDRDLHNAIQNLRHIQISAPQIFIVQTITIKANTTLLFLTIIIVYVTRTKSLVRVFQYTTTVTLWQHDVDKPQVLVIMEAPHLPGAQFYLSIYYEGQMSS
jgi:hypothetical protein